MPALVRRLLRRHPEFATPITWASVEAICQREHIVVRRRLLPGTQRGMLVRVGDYVTIRIARHLNATDALWTAVHELGHYFADDPGEMCLYADDGGNSEVEEFCDRFAWYCIDPGAREFMARWREEDF